MLVDIYRCDLNVFKELYEKPLYRIVPHGVNLKDDITIHKDVLKTLKFIGTYDTDKVQILTGHFDSVPIEKDEYFKSMKVAFRLGDFLDN
jgi:hypothetical protein